MLSVKTKKYSSLLLLLQVMMGFKELILNASTPGIYPYLVVSRSTVALEYINFEHDLSIYVLLELKNLMGNGVALRSVCI